MFFILNFQLATLTRPRHLSYTHFALKTLLASRNAGSFMFMSRVERKCLFRSKQILFRLLLLYAEAFSFRASM